jgi:hypothetical protein
MIGITQTQSPKLPHLFTTHDPMLYWQHVELMDPEIILAKLLAYQIVGKTRISLSDLLPPNTARRDFSIDLAGKICQTLGKMPSKIVKPQTIKHPDKLSVGADKHGAFGWINAQGAESFDWVISLPVYGERQGIPKRRLILGQSKMRLNGVRPTSKTSPSISKAVVMKEFAKVKPWFKSSGVEEAHFVFVTNARFVDSLDSATLQNVTIVDQGGHDKYFGASLAATRRDAAHYTVA